MRRLLEEEQLVTLIEIDSAGTSDWHIGDPPDRRATAAARRRGIELRGSARKVVSSDFQRFDYVIAMDRSNLHNLRRMAPSRTTPARIELFRNFDPGSPIDADVPDPYYGGGDGFETVLDICEAACRGLLQHILNNHEI